jgi:hypothetical protein
MICYHCKNIHSCKTFQTLYDTSKDFSINHCANYEDAPAYKYKRIAEHDELMHVIYDYFTNQIVDVNLSDDEIKDRITRAMWRL